ncbi:MAG: ATP-binding protein [Chitinophagaceae bacterium]|jgi:DNA polymerase-3 subunit delta'
MLLREVIGQEKLQQQLVDMVQHQRLSHAMLMMGPEGSGVLPLAIAFAQYIVSIPRRSEAVVDMFADPLTNTSDVKIPGPDEIEQLASYQRAAVLMHPDLHFSFPSILEKPGQKNLSSNHIESWREFINGYPYGNVFDWLQFIKADNKQGNISADECNEIIKKLSFKSFESNYKVLVMWMPEYLGKEGNKLLKLIEEPPANTIFILVAASEENILPTILSRCQLIRVPRLSSASIEKALIERAKIAPEKAAQVALMADGNYREALHLLQHSDADFLAQIRDWLNAILKNGPVAQAKWVEETSKMGREPQKQFLKYFNHLLEQSIRLKVLGKDLHLDPDLKDFALRINKIAGVGQLEAMIQELDKAVYYIERNANPKMLFMALGIKFYHIIQNKTLILTES